MALHGYVRTQRAMPIVILLLVALAFGASVALAVWHYPTAAFVPTHPTETAEEKLGHALAQHSRLRRLFVERLDPGVATGLALTLALGVLVVGGLVLGVLAYLVRSSDLLVGVDESAAEWGFDHASDVSDAGLELVTTLGETWFVIVAAIVLTVVDHIRIPTRWVAGYLALVILGQNFLTRTIKELADRVRPDLNPIAETLGPSFPSGHSATAAAFWAAAALVLARGLRRPHRALLAGGAVGIAVAVAGSRVLLDVHWLSDVIAGVCLGWAWFAVCSLAFGGRVLRFGEAVKRAEQVAVADERGAPASKPS
jgi:membrane-associated phospholipid phosphatase